MRSKFQKRSKKTGLAPGSLVHIGSKYVEKSKINLIRYSETFLKKRKSAPSKISVLKMIKRKLPG